MVADRAGGIGADAAAARTARDLLGDQRHGAVEADIEGLFGVLEVGVGLAVLHVGTEAADAGLDRLAALRVQPDLARQRQKLERHLEIDARRLGALGQSGTLRLLAVLAFAELDIRSEPAGAQRHFEAALRILAENLRAVLDRAVGRHRERTRIAAVRIVRAADEGAELAELERELAGAAHRASARIAAVGARREDVRAEHLVERVDHLADLGGPDLADRVPDVAPESGQAAAPFEV